MIDTALLVIRLVIILLKPMLEMEKEYNDIKTVLDPLFKMKEIG